MAESVGIWQGDFAINAILSVVFIWMLTKLVGIVFDFRSLQLSVTRGSAPVNATDDKDETPTDDVTAPESKEKIARVDSEEEDDDGFLVVDNDDLDDADGEIREFFEAAVTFVSSVAMGGALTLSPKDKLQLYGLYKVATCGKCNIPKPSMFNPSALAKWEAWNKLGDLPRSEAMADYVSLLTLNCPGWNHEGEDADGGGGGGRAGGPVMSTFARDPADDEADADPQHCLHRLASMGDEAALREAIQEGGHDVNGQDEEGRTPLHWAADRGHPECVELLLAHGAYVDMQDGEGQTALHYALVCEHEDVARVLLGAGASMKIPDNEGMSAADIWPPGWSVP